MSLSYNNCNSLAGNQMLLLQMASALIKQAISRVTVATGAELTLCQAIIKNPSSYANRFLLDVLIANASGLSTSDGGSTINPMPADSVMDTAVQASWTAQIAAGA